MDVKKLWAELDQLGLKEVKRKHFQEDEWFRDSDRGHRVEGWIAWKESENATLWATLAGIISVVALTVSVIGLFR